MKSWSGCAPPAGRTRSSASWCTGTLADPRWLDPAIDPNDRVPGTCFLGEPRLVNNGPVGLARFCTLRSWLSQWSYEASNADGVRSLARIAAPVLVLLAQQRRQYLHSQPRPAPVRGRAPRRDKECAEIKGATHYYIGQKAQLEQAVGVIDNWLQRHALRRGLSTTMREKRAGPVENYKKVLIRGLL